MKSKKILGFILSAMISLSAVSAVVLPTAFAEVAAEPAEEQTTIEIDTTFVTEKYEKSADDLYVYGLFTSNMDEGYDIDNSVTKADASVMLIKLLGGMDEALSGEYTSEYSDVSDTVEKYVSYLNSRGMDQADSEKKFGADEEISAADYMSMILQTTGYQVSPDASEAEVLGAAVDAGLVNEDEAMAFASLEFDRGAMAYLSNQALQLNYNGTETTMLADLCEKGGVRWLEKPTQETREGVGDKLIITEDTPDEVIAETSEAEAEGVRANIIENASKYLGTPYRRGGKTPAGFDCSGFVGYVMIETGLWDQFWGSCNDTIKQCTQIAPEEALPGDLVFFSGTGKSGYSHVGIYLGDGRIIHSASSVGVSISDITEGYWQNHYACMARPNVLM